MKKLVLEKQFWTRAKCPCLAIVQHPTLSLILVSNYFMKVKSIIYLQLSHLYTNMKPKIQHPIFIMINSNKSCLVCVQVLCVCPYSCFCKSFALFNHEADAQILLLFIALSLYRSYLLHLAIVWVVRTLQSSIITQSSSPKLFTKVQAF